MIPKYIRYDSVWEVWRRDLKHNRMTKVDEYPVRIYRIWNGWVGYLSTY